MGGKSATGTSTTTIPPQVLANYQNAVSKMATASNTPFQSYSSNPNSFVAPLNSTEQAGVAGTTAAANQAQPYYQQANAMTQAGSGTANLGTLNPTAYMSPYLNTVAKTTEALQNQSNQQQQAGQLGNAISSGAFGGDRAGVGAANLEEQQNLSNSATIANLMNQGYNTSLATAQQQQGAQLGAEQANLAREMMGGAQEAQLGSGAESAALQGAQGELQAGQLGQQTTQAGLSALYNQFLQEQAYPFQTAQAYANVAEGTGSLSGQTTTSTQPLGLFGGLLSDRRAKENIKKIGSANNGLAIYKFNYKDDPHNVTHVGFMADEVEKQHPEAVGEYGGLKTVDYDRATRAAGGGLVGFDPDLGPYGSGNAGIPGKGGYVPTPSGQTQHQMLRPNVVPMTNQNSLQNLASDFNAGKSLWGDASNAYKWLNSSPQQAAKGGRIGLDVGGTPYDNEGDDNLVNGNQSNTNHPNNLLNSVVSSGSRTPQQLRTQQGAMNPAQSVQQGGLGALANGINTISSLNKAAQAFPGIGSAAGSLGTAASTLGNAAASGLGTAASTVGSDIGSVISLLPFLAKGGAVPRKHFDDGGDSGGPNGDTGGSSASGGIGSDAVAGGTTGESVGDGSEAFGGLGSPGDPNSAASFGTGFATAAQSMANPGLASALGNIGTFGGLDGAPSPQTGDVQPGTVTGLSKLADPSSPSDPTAPSGVSIGELGSMMSALFGGTNSATSAVNPSATISASPSMPSKFGIRASNDDGTMGPSASNDNPGQNISGNDPSQAYSANPGESEPSIAAMSNAIFGQPSPAAVGMASDANAVGPTAFAPATDVSETPTAMAALRAAMTASPASSQSVASQPAPSASVAQATPSQDNSAPTSVVATSSEPAAPSVAIAAPSAAVSSPVSASPLDASPPADTSPSMFGQAIDAAKSYATKVADNISSQFGSSPAVANNEPAHVGGNYISPAIQKALQTAQTVTAANGGRIKLADGGDPNAQPSWLDTVSDYLGGGPNSLYSDLFGSSGPSQSNASPSVASPVRRDEIQYAPTGTDAPLPPSRPKDLGNVAAPVAAQSPAPVVPPVVSDEVTTPGSYQNHMNGRSYSQEWRSDVPPGVIPGTQGTSMVAGQDAPQGGLVPPAVVPRNVRNNNIGNLAASSWTQNLPGYAGSDKGLAIFDTPQHGADAMDRLLANKGTTTATALASTWAPLPPPGHENDPMYKGNNPDAFGRNIENILGVPHNSTLDLSDPAMRAKVGVAIGSVEGGIPPNQVMSATGLAGGQPAQSAPQQSGGLLGSLFGGGQQAQASQGSSAPYQAGQGERTTMAILSALGAAAQTPGTGPGAVLGALMRGAGGYGEAYMKYPQQAATIAETQQRANLVGAQTGETQVRASSSAIDAAKSSMFLRPDGSLGVILKNGDTQDLQSWKTAPKGPSAGGALVDQTLRTISGPDAAQVAQSINTPSPQAVPTGTPASGGYSIPSAPLPPPPASLKFGPQSIAAAQGEQSQSFVSDPKREASQAIANQAMAEGTAARANHQNIVLSEKTLADARAGNYQGPLAPEVSGALSTALAGTARSLGFSDAEMGQLATANDINHKVAIFSALAKAHGANQNSLGALDEAASAMPNTGMQPKAAAQIMSSLMQMDQRSMDQNDYINEYRKHSNGFTLDAQKSFDDEYKDQYAKEHNLLSTMFANSDPFVAQTIHYLNSGAVTPEQAQAALQTLFNTKAKKPVDIPPNFYRYFVSGGQ